MSTGAAGDDESLAWFRDLPEHEQQRMLSQMTVIAPAKKFIEHVWGDGDLVAAWRYVDPDLRTCLAQKWVIDNATAVASDGWEPAEVVEALAEEASTHPLWPHFERVHLRSFKEWDDLRNWGTASNTRLFAPGVEAIVFLRPGVTVWQPEETQEVYTFLMRFDEVAGWRVASLSGKRLPEPGDPPVF
jgi:hypothetical protein